MKKFALVCLMLLVVLNILDGGFTLLELYNQYAIETNPLLNWIIENGGYVGFIVIKLILVSSGILLICYSINNRLAQVASVFVCLVYLGVNIFHIWGLMWNFQLT